DAGQILSQRMEILEKSGARVGFENVSLWQKPGEPPILEDTRRIWVSAPETDLRIIDFEIFLKALVEVTIEKSNHSLFAARMAPALSVSAGGILVNAEGAGGEAGTFGKASDWCDYSGARGPIVEGLAIL